MSTYLTTYFDSPDNILSTYLTTYCRLTCQHIVDLPNNILSTYWALCHLFSTVSAGAHVPTLHHYTVNRSISMHILQIELSLSVKFAWILRLTTIFNSSSFSTQLLKFTLFIARIPFACLALSSLRSSADWISER